MTILKQRNDIGSHGNSFGRTLVIKFTFIFKTLCLFMRTRDKVVFDDLVLKPLCILKKRYRTLQKSIHFCLLTVVFYHVHRQIDEFVLFELRLKN